MCKYNKLKCSNMKKDLFHLFMLLVFVACQQKASVQLEPVVVEYSGIIQESEGQKFRDLNHNGVLDTYEDSRATIENRIVYLRIG